METDKRIPGIPPGPKVVAQDSQAESLLSGGSGTEAGASGPSGASGDRLASGAERILDAGRVSSPAPRIADTYSKTAADTAETPGVSRQTTEGGFGSERNPEAHLSGLAGGTTVGAATSIQGEQYAPTVPLGSEQAAETGGASTRYAVEGAGARTDTPGHVGSTRSDFGQPPRSDPAPASDATSGASANLGLEANRSMADRSVADRSVADRSMADRSMADRSMADRSMADRSMADRSVADRSADARGYWDDDGPGPQVMAADTLTGEKVVNGAGESLGEITDIMLDVPTGRVAYAVLSSGGFLGIGDKLYAIPWNALKLDTENKYFVLNVAKERLESAPGFDKDRWPAMADETWATEVHSYYGSRPYWE